MIAHWLLNSGHGMPRRKKNDQSPARAPGGPPERGSVSHHTTYGLPQVFDGATANNFTSSTSLSSSVNEKIVKNMQEMFSHLDPEVIYIVLSECDFKVENAMDSLLELSVAAEGAVPIPSPVSGFERTAAALLSPQQFSESTTDPVSSKQLQPESSPSTILLTEELDLLVDQELETLTTQRDVKEEQYGNQYLSSLPPPLLPKQVLPELLQSSLQPGSRSHWPSGHPVEHTSGTSSPLNQPSTCEVETVEEKKSLVDFTLLMTEAPADRQKPPLDLVASGRPSAFQVYKKQEPLHTPSENTAVTNSKAVIEGARSKARVSNQEFRGYIQPPWNLGAPVFIPHVYENKEPTFVTPVAQLSSSLSWQPRYATPWLSQAPHSQAPLKPPATIPKSWASPAPQSSTQYSRLRLQGWVLVLLRGAPGSGKTTLARAFVEHNPGAIRLSTDDYFTHNGEYQFEPSALGEAHEWNQKRVKEAFERGANPIIIDNTNMQGWEMRPYVVQALKHGYKVLFREPDTWWKYKPRELERRTTHKVPLETIRHMLNKYERFVSVQSIMGSQMPEFKQCLLRDNERSQLVSYEAPCPDLVGQPNLKEGIKKSHSQLFLSLPDVSSIGCSNEMGMLKDVACKSTESVNFWPTRTLTENPEMSGRDQDMELGELHSELNSHFEQTHPTGDEMIPECIVESVMNEDHCGDELPVAFSETIGQRVRRERPSRRSGLDSLQPADLVKDANQSDSKAGDKEKTKEEETVRTELVKDGREKRIPKILDFVGDWPTERSLDQRQVRSRQRHKDENGKEDEAISPEANENKPNLQPGPIMTEFQKLLDLIQTGVSDIQIDFSPSSSLSSSDDSTLEQDEEEAGRCEESHSSRPNSEEKEQNSICELPDCVLDWKMTHSYNVKESIIDKLEGLKTENEMSSVKGRENEMFVISKKTGFLDLKSSSPTIPLSTLDTDSSAISETLEVNVCCHGSTESVTRPPDVDINKCSQKGIETSFEAGGGSHITELCQSPVCESSVEADSGSCSGSSQERKQRQGRRSGKHCKLALTFPQNCPASSVNAVECPNTTGQNVNSSQKSNDEQNLSINCNSSYSLVPNLELFIESKSEAHLQPPLLHLEDKGCSTQTEPQDFAFLWRLNHQNNLDQEAIAAYKHPHNIIVLSGNSSHFVPELSVADSLAVQHSGHREVPYRVVHDKSTQVEEKELGVTQDRLESLRILSRHFKLVNFDTLEDLYDKCHQDLEWTTNLLLDSGEMFFKDEDKKEEDGAGSGKENTTSLSAALGKHVDARKCPDVIDERHIEEQSVKCETQSASGTPGESHESSVTASGLHLGCTVTSRDYPDTTSHLEKSPQTELQALNQEERCGEPEHKAGSEVDQEGGAWGGNVDDGLIIEESRVETEEELASMDEAHRLLQAELDKIEREERQKERPEKRHAGDRRVQPLDIQSVELKLTTEVALQLTELFGPVGVDPGTCSPDDCAVQMDLNLAKLLHQKWKETINEKQKQATLSFLLLKEGSTNWGDSNIAKAGPRGRTQPAPILNRTYGYVSLEGQPEVHSQMPFMDHWNVSHSHISLRDIMKEEESLQENIEKSRQSRADLDRRDGASLLKEKQLYSLFPTIDRHFLQDIFRDHNYSLTQTELFLRSLLDEEPVKTVIAPQAPRSDHHRAASKDREVRQKPVDSIKPDYQDTEDPEYEDFRAEASLQRRRQLESLCKAAEAFKQGRKEVASFYAQQGHMHRKLMREANHRAAVQIFQRVNSSLLPNNILDLHGLHVDEALGHLAEVLQDKRTAYEKGLCRPQLSVITGRGNHSQGGVARIRPAVIHYLTSAHYRFTEPKPGLLLVSLK